MDFMTVSFLYVFCLSLFSGLPLLMLERVILRCDSSGLSWDRLALFLGLLTVASAHELCIESTIKEGMTRSGSGDLLFLGDRRGGVIRGDGFSKSSFGEYSYPLHQN
jgi:hypothetical protein